MTPVEVRRGLVEALKLDLVGPENGSDLEAEILPQAPSRWYLTGFLVPLEAGEAQKSDETANDDFESPAAGGDATDDDTTPEPPAARRAFFPSSIGLSLLVSKQTRQLRVEVNWGDYRAEPLDAPVDGEESPAPEVSGRMPLRWRREPHRVEMTLNLPTETAKAVEARRPRQRRSARGRLGPPRASPGDRRGMVPDGTRSVSVFLVNHRIPGSDELRDERFIFQAGLAVHSADPLIPRPNLKGQATEEWDERVADLQYRDVYEYSVGHGIATHAEIDAEGTCHTARTCWIPAAEVELVAPAKILNVELRMDALAELADGPGRSEGPRALREAVPGLDRGPEEGSALADTQTPRDGRSSASSGPALRPTASRTASRFCDDKDTLFAFRMANRVMARAARRRFGPMQGKEEAAVDAPAWRPFQLAFILMNLPGIVEPAPSRPRGGGSALLPHRRRQDRGVPRPGRLHPRLRGACKNPGIASAGLSVLMRYTLRLLTLDQLGRAATLICALELERQKDRRSSAPGRSRSACGSAGPPRRTGWAARATTTRTPPARRPSPSRTTTASPPRSRSRTAPGAARSSSRSPSSSCPTANEPTDLRVGLPESTLRLHPQPAAADPGGRRADLPPPALLPDRHGGQVRGHALDRRGRGVLRPGRPLRPERILRPLRAGPRPTAARRPPAAARPDHPGRAAPDLRPLGTMVGLYETRPRRAVQPGHRRQEDPAEDRRLDRHGPPGREPDPGPVQPPDGGHLPAARSRPPRFVLRRDPSARQEQRPALPRGRRPGTQPEGRHVAGLPGAAGRRPEGLRSRRRQEERPTTPPIPT